MTVAAEYYPGTRTAHATLEITAIADGRRTHLQTIFVSGRREARTLAASLNAKPWNF